MDVVLKRKPFGVSSVNGSASLSTPRVLSTAEQLLASDLSELIAEVRQLRQRRVTHVSVRRQRALRIGPATLRDVLDDYDLNVCTVGFAGGFTGSLNRTYRQAVEDTRRALEFAASLDARAVAVLPGCRGLHTWNHAARTVKEGVEDCLDDALRFRIDMLLPANTFLGQGKDVYQPQNGGVLDWVDSFNSHRVRGMMMLRGRRPLHGLPEDWQRCLLNGGLLRVAGRAKSVLGSEGVVDQIARKLDDVAIPVG